MSIPAWLIVLVSSALAVWFYDKGWWPFGAFFRIVETFLGIGLVFGTVVFFCYWLFQLGRTVLGLQPKD